jgi:ABC-2 type transport system ATP-binding protein
MIHLEKLTKSFRGKCALEELTLDVPDGEIFGLLGHNGAGKSTTFGMILGQIHPSGGEAFVHGVSVQRNRRDALGCVGAIFETPGFYDYLSGWRNLKIFTSYSGAVGAEEMNETVRLVGLEKRIHDPVRIYSHGMRQRLALAQALLPKPDFILLDEPTEGLDPEGIHEMRNLILRLNRERGLTVLLSSHLLSEVEQMCSRVAILNQGRLVFNGQWAQLAGDKTRFRLAVDNWPKAAACVTAFGASVIEQNIISLDPGAEIATLVESLVRAGVRISAVEPLRPTLEQLYLETISAA